MSITMSNYQMLQEQSANEQLWFIVHAQIQEMELVRTKIYQLETTHVAMKSKYVLHCIN